MPKRNIHIMSIVKYSLDNYRLNILVILSIIFMGLSAFGVYKMFQSYKKIKFENYVLLSGIIEVRLKY